VASGLKGEKVEKEEEGKLPNKKRTNKN